MYLWGWKPVGMHAGLNDCWRSGVRVVDRRPSGDSNQARAKRKTDRYQAFKKRYAVVGRWNYFVFYSPWERPQVRNHR